jgi:hypothetical protein
MSDTRETSRGFEDFLSELKREALLEKTVVEVPMPDRRDPSDENEGFILISSFQDEIDMLGGVDWSGAVDSSAGPDVAEAGSETVPPVSQLERSRIRRRAVEKVNFLEMVDGILFSVGNELQRGASDSLEVLHAKRALQGLLEAVESGTSEEVRSGESRFAEESLRWFSSIAATDARISSADLRRYCENAKPALSGKALTLLARFYRMCPPSPSSRAKFEVVLTRFFARQTAPDRRKAIYARTAISQRISAMYEDWEIDADRSEARAQAVRDAVEDLNMAMREAEFSESFEDLVSDDYLQRLRLMKEGFGNDVFEPELMACIIEANLLVGNRFVELLEKAIGVDGSEEAGARFSSVCSDNISTLTAGTLKSAESFCARFGPRAPDPSKVAAEQRRRSRAGIVKRIRMMFAISPWLFVVLLVVVLSAVALYFGARNLFIGDAGPAGAVERPAAAFADGGRLK